MPENCRCHMSKNQRWLVITLILLSLPFLSACEREVTGREAEAILTWSEPTIDHLFAGFQENDYEAFSSSFDSYMQASITAVCFADWRSGVEKKLGDYLTREVHRVAQADEFYVVEYLVSFENQNSVTVSVAFHRAEHSISHIHMETVEFRSAPEPRRQCELVVGGA